MTTAVDVLRDGHGVCRDFTHLGIALCRALNIPSRYVFGYLPDIEVPDPGTPMDFCAWMEVWLGERWYTFDPRNDQHRIGRTVIGRGRDAADVAMVTTFGGVELLSMTVVAEQVVSVMALEELLDDGVVLPDHRALDIVSAREATYIFHNEVTYEYPAPIRSLRHQFVVLPRRRHGDQRRLTHRVDADVPHRATLRHRYDRFGNPVVEIRAVEVPARFSFGVRAVLHRSRDAPVVRPWRTRSTRRRPI